MQKHRIFAIITLFMSLVSIMSVYGKSLDAKHVLLINSYDQRMNWVRGIVRAVEEELDPDNNNIILHIANMDSKKFHSTDYFEAYGKLLKEKYSQSRFSLILSSDNNAFDFLRKYRDSIFPDVPVVFCGVNNFKDEQIRSHDKFTGVAEVFSARQTVEMALRLLPDTRQVYIINDFLQTGKAWKRDIAMALSGMEKQVKLTYSNNLPMEELQEKISGFEKGTIVLLGVFYTDRDGQYFTYEKVGAMLSGVSPVPVFCLLEFNMGKGVVGGKVISGYYQGQAMARIGKLILSGRDPNKIPVLKKGANRIVFDYRQMEHFAIKESVLPKGSVIINKPFSVYQAYKKEIWTILIMISMLICVVIGLVFNIIRRTRAENALKESERRFKQLADATWEGVIIHDRGKTLQINQMFRKMFGYTEKEILGKNIIEYIIAPESRPLVEDRIGTGVLDPYEAVGMKKNGTVFPMEIRLRSIVFQGEKVRVAAIRDLSEQKQMELRLRQSQKMEAIGTLAGGIAHDFNNILSAVIGFAELGTAKTDPKLKSYSYFEKILASGKRARELVRQILAFSRQSKMEKQTVAPGSIIKETTKMLRASLPSTIDIRTELTSTASVLADPVQLHQIIMNLCTNASLAMRNAGGVMEIKTDEVDLDHDFIAISPDLKSGRYLRMVISDTGHGMSEEVQSRIFEPFFTTRKQGEGTGMGLSVVHGIISSMGGAITVYSEEGRGTSFNVYMPVTDDGSKADDEKKDLPAQGGTERILFVDDEPLQVDLGKNILNHLGYDVTATTDSTEAYKIFKEDPEQFDLLITDVTMPKMPGDVLTQKILAMRPDFPVIICTGYSERLSRNRLKELGIRGFSMKPLLLREIAQKIRHALSDIPE